jgi:hypothetical protein
LAPSWRVAFSHIICALILVSVHSAAMALYNVLLPPPQQQQAEK